jgi:GT2 family glycosyltransferase
MIPTSGLFGRSEDEPPPMPLSEQSTLSYAVVICTLDRRADLLRCTESWLRQDPTPLEIVVVHGGPSNDLEQRLQELIEGAGVAFSYSRMPPSLVRQRNVGIELARGDIVFFADDDAVYLDGYAAAVLDVYKADRDRRVGGVQGTIANPGNPPATRSHLANIFLLTRLNGDGTLQLSGWPAFCTARPTLARVDVFSGPAMSFRREVLAEFKFDEALAVYYVGDDFELAYRVSRDYQLFQTPGAQVMHYSSPPQGREGERRRARMNVVNHHYLSRKLLGDDWKVRVAWAWSEFGILLLALLWWLTGRGSGRLMGTIEGQWDLLRGRAAAPPTEADNITERSEES